MKSPVLTGVNAISEVARGLTALEPRLRLMEGRPTSLRWFETQISSGNDKQKRQGVMEDAMAVGLG
ncbi:MAG: hypothetical protein V4555_03685, partial [Acidobacteriota bacterium]